MPDLTKDAENMIESLTPDETFVPDVEISPDNSVITINSSVISTNPVVAEMDTDNSAIAINSPVTSTNPVEDESIVINIPGIEELARFAESCPQAAPSEFNSNDNSFIEEKVFEIPLLNAPNDYYDYDLHNEGHNSNEALCNNQDIIDKDSLKEDTNSDCTVEYSLDESLKVNKEIVKCSDKMNPSGESVIIFNPSIGQSFSPLPSTSKDYAVIDMNDMMFNEVSSTSPKNLTDLDIKQEDSDVNTIDVKNENSNNLNVVECSSGSDNADDEVVICSEIKPSIIDLSNDDKSDSDCEIIDVDDIINENKKVLNITQFSQPKKSSNNSVEIINEIPDVLPQSSDNSLPPSFRSISPIDRPDVEAIGDPRLQHPMAESNYYPLFSEIDSLINHFCSSKTNNLGDLHNMCVNPNNTLQNGYSSLLPSPSYQYAYNDNSHNLRRKSKRRADHNLRKRRRVDPVIDLSLTSSIKPHSSSDVIVIDVDSPVSIQRSNNVAQISVSIMAPILTSTRPENERNTMNERQSNVPSAPADQTTNPPATNSHPAADSWNVESSSMTPPRRLGDCPVCLENFSKVKAVSTFCGHIFCVGCITTVKTTSKKCPTCRKPLKGKGYHPIFL